MIKSKKTIEMEELLSYWKKSSLNLTEFCEIQNIKRSKFHYWKKKLSNNDSTGSVTGNKGAFKAIEIISPETKTSDLLEIEYPSGAKIRLNASISLDYLRTLINL